MVRVVHGWMKHMLITCLNPEMVFSQLHPSVLCPENNEVEGVWSRGGQSPPRNGNSPTKTVKIIQTALKFRHPYIQASNENLGI